jgi:o-succinylbenzoate---CoA ligase
VPTRELIAVSVGLDDPFPAARLEQALDGSGPAVLLLPTGSEGEHLRAALLPLGAAGVPADTAVVVATSGSSGMPKGVRISATALEFAAAAVHEVLGGPGQWLLAMSPARIAGFAVLIRSRAAATVPIAFTSSRFDPTLFAATARRMDPRQRRYTALVPTQLIRLLDAGVQLDTFDAILLGGGPIPDGLVARGAGRGVRIVRTYGMTETCGGCVYDGLPLPGVRVAIGVGGLIRLAGPLLARGYLGEQPHTGPPSANPGFSGAWFTSSDLGHLDSAGVLHVLGRADDVIISGGVNVAPQSVEAVLSGHPGIAESAVIGRPDPEWGQEVVAVLVPKGAPLDPAELRGLVTTRLGRAHAPRDFLIVEALPRLPSGKVDRLALGALARTPQHSGTPILED